MKSLRMSALPALALLFVAIFAATAEGARSLQLLQADYRFVNADVTHQSQDSRAAQSAFDPVSYSSYEVAVFNVHFDQPAYFRGIPLPDLAAFLGRDPDHHRIFDDGIRLTCDAPNGGSPVVVSTDPLAAAHSLEDSVYLVPLDSAPRSRLQWLRAVGEQPSEPTVGFVNWNRLSLALLLRSWVGKRAPSRPAGVATERNAATAMEDLIQETRGVRRLRDSLAGPAGEAPSEGDGEVSSAADGADGLGGVERSKLVERVHFDGALLREGMCRLEFLAPHLARPKASPSTRSRELNGETPAPLPMTHAFSTRGGAPFAGSIALAPLPGAAAAAAPVAAAPALSKAGLNQTAPPAFVAVASASEQPGRVHLVHEHDTAVSFLSHSVDVRGQSEVGIPFLSILLSPITDFIKEQIGRRTPDYIKWRIRTDMFKRMIQQIVSSELFNTVEHNDHHLSILTELRSQATKEMTDTHSLGDNGAAAPAAASGPTEFDRYRFSQIKTGIGSYMTLDQMMRTKGGVSNPDQTMLRPDGCLTNPIIHHMIVSLSRVLPVSITEKIVTDQHDAAANVISNSVLDFLAPTIIDSLPNSVVPMVAMAVNYAVPPIVKRMVPLQVIKHVTTAVTDTLTRGVVHIVAPTLSHTLRDAARVEPVCYYCYYVDPRYCYICPKNRPLPASSQAHIDLYTIDFFVDYYTDYYADFYTGKKPLTSAAVKQAEGEGEG